jgi:hypothetical protein
MLVCDGCGADISDVERPVAYVPLANGGGVDLCDDCGDKLAQYQGEDT